MNHSMRFACLTFTAMFSVSMPALATPPTTSPIIDLATSDSASVADAVDTLREGTHFVGRLSHLTRLPGGQQFLLSFDNDPSQTKSPPMIVQPNLDLLSMENVIKTAAVEFRVSGTVTEYKGKNYILVDNAQTTLAPVVKPTSNASMETAKLHPAASAHPMQDAATPPPSTTLTAGDTAARKMEQLLAPQPDTGHPLPSRYNTELATNIATGTAAVAPDSPAQKLVREGTHFTDRIGRLNHSPDGGQATFTFDTDGKAMADPPMIILPNLKLGMMESAVLGRAGDLHFRVSGTVTEYKGRNYILLDKAVVLADVETQF